jgi:hypothetical protein
VHGAGADAARGFLGRNRLRAAAGGTRRHRVNAKEHSIGVQRGGIDVTTPWAGDPAPTIANTRRGPVEYASCGEGATVLALHGAMGGYDQGLILARTVGVFCHT